MCLVIRCRTMQTIRPKPSLRNPPLERNSRPALSVCAKAPTSREPARYGERLPSPDGGRSSERKCHEDLATADVALRLAALWITRECAAILSRSEPIQEDRIHAEGVGLISLRSMMRIMARRTKATTVRAWRSKSRDSRRHRLTQAKVRSTIQRFGTTSKPVAPSRRLTTSIVQDPVCAAAAAAFGP